MGLGITGFSRAVPLPPLKSFTLPTGMVMSSKVCPEPLPGLGLRLGPDAPVTGAQGVLVLPGPTGFNPSEEPEDQQLVPVVQAESGYLGWVVERALKVLP